MKKFFLSLVVFPFMATIAIAGQEPVDLSLAQAVGTALENNLGIHLKRQEIQGARGTVETARGAFDTLAAASAFHGDSHGTDFATGLNAYEQTSGWAASLQKKIETGTAFDLTWENLRYESDLGLFQSPTYSSSLSLGLTQPLLKGWGEDIQTANIQAAEKLVDAADNEFSRESVDLSAAVAESYWELLFARQNLEVKKLSLELAEKLREDTAEKIAAGALASVEIYQPESEAARREQALIEGERAVAQAEDNLKLLLNLQDWETTFIPTDQPEISEEKTSGETVIDLALATRQDIQAIASKVEATELVAKLAGDRVRPSLDLSGRLGLTGIDETYGEAMDEVTSDSDLAWQVGLTFSVPLGNRGAKGELISAQADLEQARTALAMLRQEIVRSAREAVRNERLALKNIEASRKTALALKKSLEGEENKFEVGLSTALDVLKAQEAYAEGLIGEKRALIEYALTQAELNRVKGIVVTE